MWNLRFAGVASSRGLVAISLAFCFAASINGQNAGIPRPDHVVIVVEENRGSAVVNPAHAPYIASLAQRGALFTDYFAISHPSQPNYLALFSGSTQGVSSDSCPHHFDARNLGSELLEAGFTFGGYSESLPGIGSATCESGPYARKHVPWINFVNVPARLSLPFSQFPSDFSQLPTVSFVIPNLDNDMHDGTTEQADAWLQRHIDPYVQWAQANNSLLILTWDEGGPANDVATILVGPMVQPGEYCARLNHYNLLRTLEDMFGLPYAGLSANVRPITYVWSAGNPPPTVTLTEPADGAAFVTPTNITLSAEASTGAGAIQKVEFFAGAMKLGEATNSPYTIPWRNIPPGTWCLRAKATDDRGGMHSSPNMTITVTGTASNVFLAAKGTYAGVVNTSTNSGTVILQLTRQGTFSGRLKFGRAGYPFRGRFDHTGFAETSINRRKQPPLALELSIDLFNGTGTIHGTASDGASSLTFDATRR